MFLLNVVELFGLQYQTYFSVSLQLHFYVEFVRWKLVGNICSPFFYKYNNTQTELLPML